MFIRMDDANAAPELDPLAQLDSLMHKTRTRAAGSRMRQRQEAVPEHKQPAELDFSDPKTRQEFLNSMQSRSMHGAEPVVHSGLDPERVAALLDLE